MAFLGRTRLSSEAGRGSQGAYQRGICLLPAVLGTPPSHYEGATVDTEEKEGEEEEDGDGGKDRRIMSG